VSSRGRTGGPDPAKNVTEVERVLCARGRDRGRAEHPTSCPEGKTRSTSPKKREPNSGLWSACLFQNSVRTGDLSAGRRRTKDHLSELPAQSFLNW
jgi:hypothetical protein